MNRVLVTGGGGFVGKAIIELLLKEKITCEVVGRNRYPELEDKGVKCHQGDISNRDFVVGALNGFDVVFHVAALAGIWGPWKSYYDCNVKGTENVIEACSLNGIPTLVYTSTPSVVFGREDIIGGDESLAYPSHFLCNYARSKKIAEQMVLSCSRENLTCCAIRPHLIWGPGDPHLIPRLIERGREGSLKIVGNADNMVDITYVENVAHAHILAAKNLITSKTASGKAYFIGQERPVNLWEWINDLFIDLNIAPVKKKISLKMATRVGGLLESLYGLLNIDNEPKMTRFLAEQLAKSHYFSHKRAEKDFGYVPRITIDEGLDKLKYWLKTK